MSKQDPRVWYKKKRYLIPLFSLPIIIAASASEPSYYEAPQTTPNHIVVPVSTAQTTSPVAVPKEISTPIKTTSSPSTSNNLSNNNYYTNVDGNKVHSPAYSNSGVPSGASARCRDGTYSFSQNRSGTCSHHGGVAKWL